MDNWVGGFGMVPIVIEGGIADPDRFTWDCNCNECQIRYQKWKEAFDAQQKQLEDKNT